MAHLITPFTERRQARAIRVLDAIDSRACARERLLAWNDAEAVDRDGGSVIYWMARAQRATHNLALDVAIAAARALDLPLVVAFRLGTGPTGLELRHVEWMLRGLPETFAACRARGAHVMLVGRDGPSIDELARDARAALVVADDDVMPLARAARARVAKQLSVPFVTVDADVVVPGACFPRAEYAARTLRPRLHRILHRFEHELGGDARGPRAPRQPLPDALRRAGVDPDHRVERHLEHLRAAGIRDTAPLLPTEPSGATPGHRQLRAFIDGNLHGYATRRNVPELDATSRLSAFVHFGQLSPIEILDEVRRSDAPRADIDAFVEEFVVRRELAHNLVRWNPLADRLDGAPTWARRTLHAHASDPRPHRYDDDTLAAAGTVDPLWNAAQNQLVQRGHMHGYLRMYWAKQVLLWRDDPSDAFDVVLRLNDRYSLDGRDPNGITGVAWAIGGTHDRPWAEREIFGQVRSMTLRSTGRKFDSRAYIERWGGGDRPPTPSQ